MPAPATGGGELPAARVWLIDGFNALHHVVLGGESREGWWTGPTRRRLLERVERFEESGADLWVVFDGPHPAEDPPDEGGRPARVHSLFAPSADAWLLGRVRAAEAPGDIVVVTADRKLAGRCRHAGARVVAPRDFLARCPADYAADSPPEVGS